MPPPKGAKSAGAEVDVKRVPELVPEDVAKKSGFKLDQKAPIATVDELPKYDAIIFGSGTRFGNVTAQLRNFMDQTGEPVDEGRSRRQGRLGRSPHRRPSMADRNRRSLTFIPTLMHQGMVVVGCLIPSRARSGVDEIKGGSPYGASTITGADGSRQPSAGELEAARFQGRHVAEIAAKLAKISLSKR